MDTDNFFRDLEAKFYGEIKSTQERFTWVINDFGTNMHKSKYIMSPLFATSTDNLLTQWVLTLYPNGRTEADKDISIGIQCLNRTVFAHVELSVLNIDGVKSYTYETGSVGFNENNVWGLEYVIDRFLIRSEILGQLKSFFIQNNALRVVCIITTNETIQADHALAMEQKSCEEKLTQFRKFNRLLKDTTFTDVTLCVGSEKIEAHKAILAASSYVFRAMFTHKMSEKDSNQVKIEDIDSHIIRAMLKFIYTGDVEEFESDGYDNYLGLLIAAEKYCIENLKDRCQDKLMDKLTVDNVLDCIVNADTHNASDLKAAAIDFAVANAEKIVEGPMFEEFLKCGTAISCEVVRVLVTKERRFN